MLSVILATNNPYVAKDEFLKAGWELVSETPPGSEDKLAIVSIGDSSVMLGVDDPKFLPKEARDFRGAGIDIYVELGKKDKIERVFENHSKAGVATGPLEPKPWGVNAFHARICGYRRRQLCRPETL